MAQTKINNFEKKLKTLLEGIEIMKKNGIDEEILICWLIQKTKLSRKNVQLMLNSQEEFYNKLLNETVFDCLKE